MNVYGPRFTLSLRPWCKLAHASSGGFEHRVELELRGIPAHAWNVATAEHILGTTVWIERLHPRTRSRADLDVFRLAGRTHDPDAIRRTASLEVVELLPGAGSSAPTVRILSYPISISLACSEIDRVHARAAIAARHDRDGNAGDGNGTAPDVGQDPGRSRRRGRKRRRATPGPCRWHCH
uniref:DUF4283 domain-containing protein n=1 Tax=Hordeum vulgare subsp. vulgare TaxID=112509 RepID=A0A8I6YW20_HORVV